MPPVMREESSISTARLPSTLQVPAGQIPGVLQVPVHHGVGLGVGGQDGIYVVDDDSRSLGIPAYVVPQGTGHQSHGDVGAGRRRRR